MEPDLRASTGDVAEFRSLGADIAVCSPANDFVYRSNPVIIASVSCFMLA